MFSKVLHFQKYGLQWDCLWRKEVFGLYVYERAILKTFTQVDKKIESLKCAVYKKAVTSCADLRPADVIAGEILDKVEKRELLIGLRDAVNTAIEKMKPEHVCLLGMQYGVGKFAVSKPENKNRNYYRKVALAVRNFSKALNSLGYGEKEFILLVNKFHFIKEEYDKSQEFKANVEKSSTYKINGKFVSDLKPNNLSKSRDICRLSESFIHHQTH